MDMIILTYFTTEVATKRSNLFLTWTFLVCLFQKQASTNYRIRWQNVTGDQAKLAKLKLLCKGWISSIGIYYAALWTSVYVLPVPSQGFY